MNLRRLKKLLKSHIGHNHYGTTLRFNKNLEKITNQYDLVNFCFENKIYDFFNIDDIKDIYILSTKGCLNAFYTIIKIHNMIYIKIKLFNDVIFKDDIKMYTKFFKKFNEDLRHFFDDKVYNLYVIADLGDCKSITYYPITIILLQYIKKYFPIFYIDYINIKNFNFINKFQDLFYSNNIVKHRFINKKNTSIQLFDDDYTIHGNYPTPGPDGKYNVSSHNSILYYMLYKRYSKQTDYENKYFISYNKLLYWFIKILI